MRQYSTLPFSVPPCTDWNLRTVSYFIDWLSKFNRPKLTYIIKSVPVLITYQFYNLKNQLCCNNLDTIQYEDYFFLLQYYYCLFNVIEYMILLNQTCKFYLELVKIPGFDPVFNTRKNWEGGGVSLFFLQENSGFFTGTGNSSVAAFLYSAILTREQPVLS